MVRKGQKQITVSEKLFDRLKAKADAEGISMPKLIERALEERQHAKKETHSFSKEKPAKEKRTSKALTDYLSE